MDTVTLTPQQEAIIRHDSGPALVFAVAGAGKTTAMEHRIARLVRDGVFPASGILASAFNRSAANELHRRLRGWSGCHDVNCSTLHALGLQIVRSAHGDGYLPWLSPKVFGKDNDIAGAGDEILRQTLALARQRKVNYVDDLENMDRRDFLDYVGAAKNTLAYADLARATLPAAALNVASQAPPPPAKDLKWYLDLYRLYEAVRTERGLITFDDMLMTGWEMLVCYEEMRHEFQARYQCVLVDEFQDVNLAQAEILDIITAAHRNYMAIGDDDQTIYEWRGAETSFILGFEQRYGAAIYFMTENFRCRASHVALANRVIEHNKQRRAKRMALTRGFAGTTHVIPTPNAEAMGRAIMRQIAAAHQQGQTLLDIVVLVRIFAQTAPIEQALIGAQIPYEIVGDLPFYERHEVQTLVDYCRLAFLEGVLKEGQRLSAAQAARFHQCWNRVYWQPKRYIKRDVARSIAEYVTRTGTPLTNAIHIHASEVRSSVAEKMADLATDIAWLTRTLPGGPDANMSAATVLRELESRLGYEDFLTNNSGFEETGRTRAQTVAAFINYAEDKGNLHDFLRHVLALGQQARALQKRGDEDRLIITSIHRAKGREWHTVIVPGCNHGIIPNAQAGLEEERRLLYVAITRARELLYLYHEAPLPLSRFLQEADHKPTLNTVQRVQEMVDKPPVHWTAHDLALLTVYAEPLGIQAFLCQRWPADDATKQTLARLMVQCQRLVQTQKLAGILEILPDALAGWLAVATVGENAEAATLWTHHQGEVTRILQSEATKRRKAAEAERKRQRAAAVQAAQATKLTTRNWVRGELVMHEKFGAGRVVSVLQDLPEPEVWVRFKRGGLKRLPVDSPELDSGIPF